MSRFGIIDRVQVVTLLVLSFAFAVVGCLGFVVPEVLFDPIALPLESSAGLAEIRAAYGGLFCTMSFVFAVGARRAEHRSSALLLAVLVLGGFVLGRLISWGMDGAPTNLVAQLNLGLEFVGFVVTLVLLRAHSSKKIQSS